jgi:hypothetical protein
MYGLYSLLLHRSRGLDALDIPEIRGHGRFGSCYRALLWAACRGAHLVQRRRRVRLATIHRKIPAVKHIVAGETIDKAARLDRLDRTPRLT